MGRKKMSTSPSEHLTDNQVHNMIAPITRTIEELQRLNQEQRVRIIAGLACFFGCSIEVVERIERAGREGAKRG